MCEVISRQSCSHCCDADDDREGENAISNSSLLGTTQRTPTQATQHSGRTQGVMFNARLVHCSISKLDMSNEMGSKIGPRHFGGRNEAGKNLLKTGY